MFLGTEREWLTGLGCLAVILIGFGLFAGVAIGWIVSGPSDADVCRMQGGSFNGGICYVETDNE
jgi:hypothetical protein